MRTLLYFTLLFSFSISASEEVARVVSVTGEVTAGPRSLRVGDALEAGTMVKTGVQGTAKLFLADKSVVDLGKQTSFTIETSVADVGSSTRLNYGMVRSAIRKKMEKKIKFQMRTQTSVLAVRGTEFIVRSQTDGQNTHKEQVTVTDGQVAAGIGDTPARLINPGQQFEVAGRLVGGEMKVNADQTRVVQLAPEALASLTQQATVNDSTFRKSVEISSDPGEARSGMGGATLGAAVAAVAQDSNGKPDIAAPSVVTTTGPQSVGTLNSVDQSNAAAKLTTGVLVRVLFRP